MWQNIESNPTYRAIQRVRQLTEMVITGRKQLQMFCSIAGIGKTETVLQTMAAYNMKPHFSSPANAGALCQDLWHHRNNTYFLDDCDKFARSEPCANIAKMAYGPQRVVSVPLTKIVQTNEDYRLADDDKYNPNIPPPTFRLGNRHGMVWNSNKNFTQPNVVAKELAADFRALVSRGLDPLWIPSDPQSTLDYTIWLIVTGMLRRHRQGGLPDGGGFKLAEQQEVLDFICTKAAYLTELTPRLAWKLAAARRHDPDYQMAWRSYLSDTPINPVILPETVPRLISPAMRRANTPESPNDPGPVKPEPPPDPEPNPEPPAPPDDPEPSPQRPPNPQPERPRPAAIRGAPPGAPIPPFPNPLDVIAEWKAKAVATATPKAKRKSHKPWRKSNKTAPPPVTINRDAILQDVSKLLLPRIRRVAIRGSSGDLRIKAHSEDKFLFIDATWPAQPDISDQFTLEIVDRHEGRFLTREHDIMLIGNEHAISDIAWEDITTPFAEIKSRLAVAVKLAKADRIQHVGVTVTDGDISFAPNFAGFPRQNLEWLLRRNLTALRYYKNGIIGATVTGIAGDYIVTLRGTEA